MSASSRNVCCAHTQRAVVIMMGSAMTRRNIVFLDLTHGRINLTCAAETVVAILCLSTRHSLRRLHFIGGTTTRPAETTKIRDKRAS